MATVYLGRSEGEAGFQRLFAIKVLHPHLADDEAFRDMLLDEARIAARLHHPNVVPIVDLGSDDGLFYVVMEYVEGCSLHALLVKNRESRPPRLLIPIILDALSGLHAAHALVDEDGNPMNLVHRDVSPQNILVGIEGTARITDFGVARAEARIISTRPGEVKGKVSYMSPEQIKGGKLDCRSDVFAAGAMLWSALTGRRLFSAEGDAGTMTNILQMEVVPPSTVGLKPPPAFDAVCLRALEKDPAKRWSSALEMEDALREAAVSAGLLGSRREVADWVKSSFETELSARHSAIRSATAVRERIARNAPESSSGFRMMPKVGSPDMDVEFLTPSSARRSTVDSAPPESRKKLLFAAAALTLVSVTIFATWAALRGAGSGAATHPEVAPSVAVATPPAGTPAKQTPPAASVAAIDPLPATTATGAAPTTTAQPKVFTQAAGAAVRNPRLPPPTTASATAAPAAPPPTATSTGPKPAWDPDSRLPPQ
jgi:serine/threonine-protein kinase